MRCVKQQVLHCCHNPAQFAGSIHTESVLRMFLYTTLLRTWSQQTSCIFQICHLAPSAG